MTIFSFAIFRLVEHVSSLWEKNSDESKQQIDPERFTVVIPAYLPAEKNIIINTINYFLSLDFPLEIVLVYNTPEDLPIETELAQMPIRVIKVPNSSSKAENLNYVLPQIETEFTAIFDADHQPVVNNFYQALYEFYQGYDIVQGTCLPLIDSPLSKFLSVELNQMYNVNHYARQCLWGFAIFGGSNAYFRTELLQKLRFNNAALTEDIDLTLRAILCGSRIRFNRKIVSYERAPGSLAELWKQRSRWAQGWLQVSLRYNHALIFGGQGHLSLRQKVGLFFLFPLREIGQLIILQPIPLAIALSIQSHTWWVWTTPWLTLFAFTLSLLLSEPLWVFQVRGQRSVSFAWFCLYAVLSPIYLLFLTNTVLHAY
ncbi:glycosyltransferase family 2 protein [bacterium]|nr:glycosyltransferase family 2 protein [bacterium]